MSDVFPKVIKFVESGSLVYFIDEAVFSSKLCDSKVWALPGTEPPKIIRRKIGFPAVAVTAAIDFSGKVVSVLTCKHSVN
jgi:hypothetical protein